MTLENATQDGQTTLGIFIDSTGLLAHYPGIPTICCSETAHVKGVLDSAVSAALAGFCSQCGESMHFTGAPQRCPVCAGNDTQCSLCQGKGDQPCVYIVSTPRVNADPSPTMTRASFRSSIEEAWGDVLEEFDILVNAAQELAVHLFDQVADWTDKHEVLARMAGRACQIADATNCLLHDGHPDAAFAQSRTLLEIEFNMMAIHYDTASDIAQRFKEWGLGKTFRSVKNLRQLGIHEMAESDYQIMEAEHQTKSAKYGASFRRDNGWVGRDVFERAKKANQEADYRKFYTAASSFVHTDSTALFSPIGLSEANSGRILVGPSGIGLDLAAMRTAVSLIHIIIELPNMLEVEEDEQTSAAFETIVKSTNAMMHAIEIMGPRNLHVTRCPQNE